MLTRLKKDGTKTEQLRVCDPIFRDEICGSIQNLKKVNILSEHAPDSPEMYSENLHGRLVLLGYLAGLVDA
jgi:(p)ppGpp synthase/HD superfamily hydrolase